MSNSETRDQHRHWSRHATRYDDVFLDPFRPEVVNPVVGAIRERAVSPRGAAIDLGCGTGPLLPLLLERFGEVVALDFAAGMLRRARTRLGANADRVTFLQRSMDELADQAERFELAVAVNSLVMPDMRLIDRTLRAIRAALVPGGLFLGAVPAIDAIQYHTMLLMDRALDEGQSLEEAERHAAHHAEHHYYDFAYGWFRFEGLHQKFWHGFELDYRLRKAGFSEIRLDKILYPWDDHVYGGGEFAGQPPSWDWAFFARP